MRADEDARRERMAALREAVLRRNIFDWAIEVLDRALDLDPRTPTAAGAAARNP